jgi:hypothetical protein
MTDGIVNIRGKEYQTVALRVGKFREKYPDYTIETQLILQDEEKVIMKALIFDGDKMLATGYAEEIRGSSNINQTSALENCETSAIGRCLAALGMAGTEYASADEVAGAISQQREKELYKQFTAHMGAVQTHWESLEFIRESLLAGNLPAALEAWREIGEDDMRILWRAPSKGGWFSTLERKLLDQASNEDFVQKKADAAS